jgi:hypothetical protein
MLLLQNWFNYLFWEWKYICIRCKMNKLLHTSWNRFKFTLHQKLHALQRFRLILYAFVVNLRNAVLIYFCDENVSVTFSLNQRSGEISSHCFPKRKSCGYKCTTAETPEGRWKGRIKYNWKRWVLANLDISKWVCSLCINMTEFYFTQ